MQFFILFFLCIVGAGGGQTALETLEYQGGWF